MSDEITLKLQSIEVRTGKLILIIILANNLCLIEILSN